MSFIAALRHDGITAPCVFDGPINGERILAWVRQFLVPTLKPGDIVIMDNLGSHKGAPSETPYRGPEPGSSSCRLTPPTAIPSSKSSPNSNACSGEPKSAPKKQHGAASDRSSTTSHRRNAPNISGMQVMTSPNRIRL